ncbi:MAG TPA: hypothetical protein VGM03_07820 [Phycisphaerae bacterium]
MGAWLRTSWQLIRRPASFYGALALRSNDDAARAFANWHYVVLGSSASLCALGNLLPESRYLHYQIVPIAAMFGIIVPLLGWLTHRTLAAIAGTVWIARRDLPDFAWVTKVIAYETAFVWVPGLYLGALLTSLNAFGSWISWLLRVLFPNAPVRVGEPTVVLLGLAVIAIIWLLRYRLVLRRIRWSNY